LGLDTRITLPRISSEVAGQVQTNLEGSLAITTKAHPTSDFSWSAVVEVSVNEILIRSPRHMRYGINDETRVVVHPQASDKGWNSFPQKRVGRKFSNRFKTREL
jgi:hypothetical protein